MSDDVLYSAHFALPSLSDYQTHSTSSSESESPPLTPFALDAEHSSVASSSSRSSSPLSSGSTAALGYNEDPTFGCPLTYDDVYFYSAEDGRLGVLLTDLMALAAGTLLHPEERVLEGWGAPSEPSWIRLDIVVSTCPSFFSAQDRAHTTPLVYGVLQTNILHPEQVPLRRYHTREAGI